MPQRTLDQKVAELEAQIARLRLKSRQLETGQKIILGGMLLASARHDPKVAQWLLSEVEVAVTRDVDRKRLEPLIEELRAKQPPPT